MCVGCEFHILICDPLYIGVYEWVGNMMVGANPVVGPVQLDSNFAQLLSKEEENKRREK